MEEKPGSDPKMAHVNLMVDTIVASLPEEGLRSVLRSMLAVDPSITRTFEERVQVYLTKQSTLPRGPLFTAPPDRVNVTTAFRAQQGRIRAMLGCGMCFQSMPLLATAVEQAANAAMSVHDSADLRRALSSIDGDIIQALTAILKMLRTSSGSRSLDDAEQNQVHKLYDALVKGEIKCRDDDYPFARSLAAIRVSRLLPETIPDISVGKKRITVSALPEIIETFSLNSKSLPRLFSGLWQLSSTAWGIPSLPRIQSQFQHYTSQGFTAYDMADHYGDAEILFGSFRSSLTNPTALFGATKYCIFTPIQITPEVVAANISERCQRMQADYIDLLQFHWQDYSDEQYLAALQHLQADARVRALGLCNFDTEHMRRIVRSGVEIATNQVQFSLIDSRPLKYMIAVCREHGVKLLTYGTLLGGYLSEKWLGKPEPLDGFGGEITPSQRKYYEMILNWGGWQLFQELLVTLQGIAAKHNVDVSCVAMRWVLDIADDVVGAVIVGTRWGISGHAEENVRVYGWKLDADDLAAIEDVLKRSRRDEMVSMLGDCGGEYR